MTPLISEFALQTPGLIYQIYFFLKDIKPTHAIEVSFVVGGSQVDVFFLCTKNVLYANAGLSCSGKLLLFSVLLRVISTYRHRIISDTYRPRLEGPSL